MKHLLKNLEEVRVRLSASKPVYLLLDYDGTLTPIVMDPRKAKLDRYTMRLLCSFSRIPSCILAIVSGRALADLRRLVAIKGIYYMGNHGLEICGPHLNYTNEVAQKSRRSLKKIFRQLGYLESLDAVVEDKGLTLTVHLRRVLPRDVSTIKSVVHRTLQSYAQLRVTYGKKVLEIRPRTGWNKGLAARWLISQLGDGLPIYIGDDQTDEDAFTKLSSGITVLVSKSWRPSAAEYRLRNHEDVSRFLRYLLLWFR